VQSCHAGHRCLWQVQLAAIVNNVLLDGRWHCWPGCGVKCEGLHLPAFGVCVHRPSSVCGDNFQQRCAGCYFAVSHTYSVAMCAVCRLQ
jgi:hypothetical protein